MSFLFLLVMPPGADDPLAVEALGPGPWCAVDVADAPDAPPWLRITAFRDARARLLGVTTVGVARPTLSDVVRYTWDADHVTRIEHWRETPGLTPRNPPPGAPFATTHLAWSGDRLLRYDVDGLSDGTIDLPHTLGYDAAGRPVTWERTDDTGRTTYTLAHDAAGRIVRATWSGPDPTNRWPDAAFAWDAKGRLVEVVTTRPGGRTVTQSFVWEDGRLARWDEQSGPVRTTRRFRYDCPPG